MVGELLGGDSSGGVAQSLKIFSHHYNFFHSFIL